MRKFLMVSVSAAGLGLALSAAQAADVVAPEPVATFTGFHIGVGGGAGYNTYDAISEFGIGVFDDGEPVDGDPDNFLGILCDDCGSWYGFGTVEIGFDYQFPDSPLVVGILANYDFNGSNDAHAASTVQEGDGDFADSFIEAELDDSWFVGGRLGFVLNENTLFYGLGGYTWVDGKVEAFHETDEPFPEAALFQEKDSVDGFTVGGGIEHLITENLSLKVEYRHDFLDDIKWNQFAFDPTDEDDGDFIDEDNGHRGSVDFDRDTIRAVISWRFNPGM